MRVLVVNGFANSKSGKVRFAEFHKTVTNIVNELNNNDVDPIEFWVVHRSKLDPYIYELNSEFMDPLSITRFDKVDMIVMDGDSLLPPWSPLLRKVSILAKMALLTGKCIFGCGFTASLLAYIAATGGDLLSVVNGGGHGTNIDQIEAFELPEGLHAGEVFLDNISGDIFEYNRENNCWKPSGNIGLVLHTMKTDKRYGTKKSVARPTVRYPYPTLGQQKLYPSKLGELQCCVRLEKINHWCLNRIEKRDFMVACESKWDLDEEISRTSSNCYTTIIDSRRGPMLIEFGHAMCGHFRLGKLYPETCHILRNYIEQKHQLIKEHEHLDQSYAIAVSGPLPIHRSSMSTKQNMRRPKANTGKLATKPNASIQLNTTGIISKVSPEETIPRAENQQIFTRSIANRSIPRQRPATSSGFRTKPTSRLNLSQSIGLNSQSRSMKAAPTKPPENKELDTQGNRTSPKRCRPYSAHPSFSMKKQPISVTRRRASARPISASHRAASRNTEARAAPKSARSRSDKSSGALSSSLTARHRFHIEVANAQFNASSDDEEEEILFVEKLEERYEGTKSSASTKEFCGPSSIVSKKECAAVSPRPEMMKIEVLSSGNNVSHSSKNSCTLSLDDDIKGIRQTFTSKKPVAIKRVNAKDPKKNPYCGINKFKEMEAKEKKQHGGGYYSIVNDGPYVTPYEQERIDHQRNKLKWVGTNDFKRTFGKASMVLPVEGGIVNTGPYDDSLTPFNIINRVDDRKQFINPERGFQF